jgi:hypothetical protein
MLWGSRFFETQEDVKCGKHALNNMLQGPQFVEADIQLACVQVCSEIGEPASQHMAPRGWYSHSVLASLLDLTVPPIGTLLLEPADQTAYDSLLGDAFHGMLLNLQNRHWVCIVKEQGHLFYVDSCNEPVTIDRHDFNQIIAKYPMSFLIEKRSE